MSEGETRVAFTAFYELEHGEQVRRAVLLVGSQAVAEELVHEAFLGVLTRWNSVDAPGAYLNTSVVHACRRYGRRRNLVDVGEHRDSRLVEIGVDGPEEGVVIAQLLLTLPFRQRASIVLRF